MENVYESQYFSKCPILVMKTFHKAAVKRHDHRFFEFVYVKQGFAMHNCKGTTSILTPGDIFSIFPNTYHSYSKPKNNTIYNCLFKKEGISNRFDELTRLPGLDSKLSKNNDGSWNRVHMNPSQSLEIESILEKMISENIEMKTGWKLRMETSLIDFLILFSRAYESQYKKINEISKTHRGDVFAALLYMEKNHVNPINIHEIAKDINLNADYFTRIFKQFTGLTPTEYVRNLRLAEAVALLSNSNMSVSDISVNVGFDDPAYFTRQFKKFMGVSPSLYRKNVLYDYYVPSLK